MWISHFPHPKGALLDWDVVTVEAIWAKETNFREMNKEDVSVPAECASTLSCFHLKIGAICRRGDVELSFTRTDLSKRTRHLSQLLKAKVQLKVWRLESDGSVLTVGTGLEVAERPSPGFVSLQASLRLCLRCEARRFEAGLIFWGLLLFRVDELWERPNRL